MSMQQLNGSSPEISFKRRFKPGELRRLWISRIIIWFFIFLAVFPILYIIGNSLSSSNSFASDEIFPSEMTLDNYKQLFDGTLKDDFDFLTTLKNSIIVCTLVCIAQMFMVATSAYAFSRMRFRGRKYGLMALLIIQMFPAMLTVSAILTIMFKYQLTDNHFVLALFISGASAFNIWLMKGFMDSLPRELDEAAMVDGATHWQVFTKIIIPLSMPMFAVILLMSFLGAYNEFVFSASALMDPGKKTVAVAMQQFIDQQFNKRWTQFSAAAVIASVPQLIIFLSLQRFLQSGLTAGSVKG